MIRSLLVLSLLVGLLWSGFLAWVGIHTTGDSVAYFRTALELSEHGALNMNPIWPPLYPMLLGGMTMAVGLPAEAAGLLSGLLLTALLFSSGWIVAQATRDGLLAAAVILFCCGWWELLYVFRVAWSEQLYAALVAVHLVAIVRHCRSGTLLDFALAAVTASLVVLSRYLGYALLGIFLVYSAATVLRRGDRRRHLAVLVAASSPLLGWLLFNLYRTSTLHGERTPTDLTALENLQLLASVFSAQLWHTPMLTALLLSGVVAMGVVLWRGQGWTRTLLLYVSAYLMLYAALLVYAASSVQMDEINPRFLSPILPTVLLGIILAASGLAQQLPKARGPILQSVTALLLVGVLGGMGSWKDGMATLVSGVNTTASHQQGGFSASQTAESLNALFAERLSQQSRLAVGLLTSESNGNKASVMVMRRAVLEGEGLQDPRYTALSKRMVSISLELEGKERELLAWSPRLMADAADVQHALHDALAETGAEELLVITRKKVLRKTGVPDMDLATLSQLRCEAEASITPYLIYTCSEAVSRDTTPARSVHREG